MSASVERGRPGPKGPAPLGIAVRQRLLRELLNRAQAGDAASAESLIGLSLQAEHAREVDRQDRAA